MKSCSHQSHQFRSVFNDSIKRKKCWNGSFYYVNYFNFFTLSTLADLDGDGIIEKSEFETTYREAEGVDKVYEEDFHIIDTDRNKKITRLELMVSIANSRKL